MTETTEAMVTARRKGFEELWRREWNAWGEQASLNHEDGDVAHDLVYDAMWEAYNKVFEMWSEDEWNCTSCGEHAGPNICNGCR